MPTAKVIEGINPEPLKAPAGLSHYPLTDKEEQEWLKQFNTDFKKREETPFSAVVRELNRVSVSALLNNGTKDGKVQTISLSLGTLNTGRYDDQKAMNIIELLKPCLSKNVLSTQETKVSILSNGE